MSAESDRKTVRQYFYTLLAPSLVGAGRPFIAGYDHMVGDFGGQSPVLVVGSDGTGGRPMTSRGRAAQYYMNVYDFVLHSGPNWTETDSEDLLDTLEPLVFAVIAGCQVSDYWQAIDYAAKTQTGVVVISNIPYRRELIPLVFSVY